MRLILLIITVEAARSLRTNTKGKSPLTGKMEETTDAMERRKIRRTRSDRDKTESN